ncbi:hypothetical protein [Streptomyces sp. NPDC093094]|uniref:hypothetical protein n=1 Tax=Streptomyces sp. NPDC093094 TaxID=3366026 RepID=UPI003812A54C
MLDQALTALASAAGVAVAQAAGTDAWQNVRDRVARLFGRGPAPGDAERTTRERLDRTAAQLEGAEPEAAQGVRTAAAAAWETRFQDLLEELDQINRSRTAAELRELVASTQASGSGVAAGDGGIAIGGNAHVQAENQAAAALRMGDVTIGNPPSPGPDKG